MQVLSKERALQHLRARIETIEKRPALADTPESSARPEGLFALPPGLLHEVFAENGRDAGATYGFTLGLARRLLSARRPALLLLQLTHQAQDLGVPYPVGLKSFGVDPDQVVFGRMESATDLLWAIEEAIGCPAVAAVIADTGPEIKALDFTASRRLSMRAAAGGSSVFLLRTGTTREASAARLRWRIEPQPSAAPPFDARAPGLARWKVELEKGRLGSRRDPKEWLVDWTENGFAVVAPEGGMGARPAAGVRPPLPGALPAALGDRLSQAG
jgi:protein ImuA